MRVLRIAFLVFLLGQTSLLAQAPQSTTAKTSTTRVVGVIRDETNAIPLPGVPVEVVGTPQVVYTDVDGRYVLQLSPGAHEIKVALEGYQEKLLNLQVGTERTHTADVSLVMTKFAETVTVTAARVDAETSSAESQLLERRSAPVITDNIGNQEMKSNGDSDAAAALTRVTGMSVVDGQYVFVRGLGERYSNTTLGGAVLPTTEPDKKVVPLDLFPSGLVDSIQVNKTFSPDRSAEFAGGLVQIVPLKFPTGPNLDLSYGFKYFSTATGKAIPLSPLGNNDFWGFDGGARALPQGFPSNKIVRQGIYTPDVGYTADQIADYGKMLGNQWRPITEDGVPGPEWSAAFGNRFGKLGVVASANQWYREQYVAEDRRFFHIANEGELEALSDYKMVTGTQKSQLGGVANFAYQFTPNHRLSLENFYSHSGRDEGRQFQGFNLDNAREYRNYRLQFTEEGLLSNSLTGEHFFQHLANSRIDWRVNSGRATRDEPDLRETLYERLSSFIGTDEAINPFTYADESQSGFHMFNALSDDTFDAAANWAMMGAMAGKPTQFKFGFNYIDRHRDFESRRFHFIPITTQKADTGNLLFNPLLQPEELFVPSNIGTAFRFNEETRPVDGYTGDQTTAAGYGMIDATLGAHTRLVAGARVENFDQTVVTQDPFGLFAREITAVNQNTDVFPGINFVQALGSNTNLRLSYATTVNRPEFRELAEFEFTDVVGNRAVKGNAELNRALIQNVDARWEKFTGARGIIAASAFFKYFDQPIERVIIAAANPISTYQNADHARNFGIELEAGHQVGPNFFVNANYTYVDSQISLLPEQLAAQTNSERPLAGQSKNLFNLTAEFLKGGFSTRVLFNYFGDRIADVGAFESPDIVEEGRGALDVVFGQKIKAFSVRLTLENLNDPEYKFTQTLTETETQRLFKLGRTVSLSVGFRPF